MKVVGIFWASKGFSPKIIYEGVLVIKGSWETWESGSSFTASAPGPFTHLLPYSLSQILAAPEQHRSPRGLWAGSGPQDLSGSGICWCCFLSNNPLPAEAMAPVVTIPVGGQRAEKQSRELLPVLTLWQPDGFPLLSFLPRLRPHVLLFLFRLAVTPPQLSLLRSLSRKFSRGPLSAPACPRCSGTSVSGNPSWLSWPWLHDLDYEANVRLKREGPAKVPYSHPENKPALPSNCTRICVPGLPSVI